MSGATDPPAPACADMRLLIQADHDGELDAARAADLARHLEHCAACAGLRGDLRDLSGMLRLAAPQPPVPAALARRIRARAGLATAHPRAWPLAARPRLLRQAPGFLAGLAVAASLALLVLPRAGPETPVGEAVAAHIRALQPGHLLDVVSTSQHTVKPWFGGRLDFAPPVPDFAAQGFALAGGRLDYLGDRPVAALVYRHGLHVIDVFVWPQAGAGEAPQTSSDHGFEVTAWRQAGMAFRIVSDLGAAERSSFVALWRAALAGA